jgi:hypothetical protein
LTDPVFLFAQPHKTNLINLSTDEFRTLQVALTNVLLRF